MNGTISEFLNQLQPKIDDVIDYFTKNKIDQNKTKIFIYFYISKKKKLNYLVRFARLINQTLRERIPDKRKYMNFKKHINFRIEYGLEDFLFANIKLFSVELFLEYIVNILRLNYFTNYDKLEEILSDILIHLNENVKNKKIDFFGIPYVKDKSLEKYKYILIKLTDIYNLFFDYELENNNEFDNRYYLSEFFRIKWEEIKRYYI